MARNCSAQAIPNRSKMRFLVGWSTSSSSMPSNFPYRIRIASRCAFNASTSELVDWATVSVADSPTREHEHAPRVQHFIKSLRVISAMIALKRTDYAGPFDPAIATRRSGIAGSLQVRCSTNRRKKDVISRRLVPGYLQEVGLGI